MRGAMRAIVALVRDRRGVTVVEFAMVAPALVLILVGGLDFTYRLYVNSLLQGALVDSARLASVENPGIGGTGSVEERVAALIKDQVDTVAPSATITVTQSNYYDFAGIGNPEKIVTDVDTDGTYDEDDGDCFEDINANGEFDLDAGRTGRGGANDVVFYEASLSMKALTPLRSFVGGDDKYNLKAQTAIRNQPWDEQPNPAVICGTPA